MLKLWLFGLALGFAGCKGSVFNCSKDLRTGFGFDCFEDLRTGGFLRGIGCCSHVLWCYGMGPLAYCCPNFLPSMLVLSHSWVITLHSRWGSRFPDESRLFL